MAYIPNLILLKFALQYSKSVVHCEEIFFIFAIVEQSTRHIESVFALSLNENVVVFNA